MDRGIPAWFRGNGYTGVSGELPEKSDERYGQSIEKVKKEKYTEYEIRFAATGYYEVNLYNQMGIPAVPFVARVSAINSGIAGDTVCGMLKRLKRNVIRYQPDLVIINACLNWDKNCGNTSRYGDFLLEIVRKIKAETKADIIMMTPNKAIEGEYGNPDSPLEERVL